MQEGNTQQWLTKRYIESLDQSMFQISIVLQLGANVTGVNFGVDLFCCSSQNQILKFNQFYSPSMSIRPDTSIGIGASLVKISTKTRSILLMCLLIISEMTGVSFSCCPTAAP